MGVPRRHLQPSLKEVYDYMDEREAVTTEGTTAELEAGTVETPRTWSPKTLHDYIDSQLDTSG